jgi:hypothetical protein
MSAEDYGHFYGQRPFWILGVGVYPTQTQSGAETVYDP